MYVKRACIQKLVALLLWMACMYFKDFVEDFT